MLDFLSFLSDKDLKMVKYTYTIRIIFRQFSYRPPLVLLLHIYGNGTKKKTERNNNSSSTEQKKIIRFGVSILHIYLHIKK